MKLHVIFQKWKIGKKWRIVRRSKSLQNNPIAHAVKSVSLNLWYNSINKYPLRLFR